MRLLTGLTVAVVILSIAAGQTPQESKSTVVVTDRELIAEFWASARKQISLDAKFRPEQACVSARKAIRYYRGRTWDYQDELRISRSPTLYPEKVPGRCRYLRWRTRQWRAESQISRAKRDNFFSGSNYERARHIIYATFPRATAHRALGVCGCETGGLYNNSATNSSSGTAGLFQIHPGNVGTVWCWKGHGCMSHTSSTDLYDPWINTKLALYMSRGGYNWGSMGACLPTLDGSSISNSNSNRTSPHHLVVVGLRTVSAFG